MSVIQRGAIVIVMFVLAFSIFASGRGGGGKSSGSSGLHGSSVYVRGYTRKDGTYVNGYVRSAPGAGASSSLHETDLDANRADSSSEPRLTDVRLRRPAQAASTPTKKQASQAAPSTIPRVTVLADALTKFYCRPNCAAPTTAKLMQRTAAISKGYRPSPDCYSHH
jgi:hypothetical protein